MDDMLDSSLIVTAPDGTPAGLDPERERLRRAVGLSE